MPRINRESRAVKETGNEKSDKTKSEPGKYKKRQTKKEIGC